MLEIVTLIMEKDFILLLLPSYAFMSILIKVANVPYLIHIFSIVLTILSNKYLSQLSHV